MFYGEGWDMCYELKKDEKGSANNYKNLPNIAFFNDTFRNVAIGSIFKDRIKDKGFVSGRIDNLKDIDYVFLGTCVSNTYDAKFDNANRSINYVECHDNFTLFDKLQIVHENEDIEDLLKRVKLANKFTMISFGIPFFHMGQEIGQSKNMQDNTYNIPKINNLDYRLVDERFEMVSHLKNAIALRKRINWYKLYKPKDIDAAVDVDFWNNKIFCLKTKDKKYCEPFEELMLLANNECENKNFDFESYYAIIQGVELPHQ